MNKLIQQLERQSGLDVYGLGLDRVKWKSVLEKFAELIIEETLDQVDERVYGRGENSWYYDDDKQWVRLHFGYGELK